MFLFEIFLNETKIFIREIYNFYFVKIYFNNINIYNPFEKFKKKKILVDLVYQNKKYQFYNLILSKYITKITGLELVALIKTGDIETMKDCYKYNIKNFCYFQNTSLKERLENYLHSYINYKKITSVKKLLKLNENKITIGKIIYDNAIKIFNVGSIDEICKKFSRFFITSYAANFSSIKIFSSKNFSFFIQSEKHWIPANILFQNALLYKTKVLCRIGNENNLSLRLYDKFANNFSNKAKITKSLYKKIYKKRNLKDKIHKICLPLLKKRFDNNLTIYQKNKKLYFCKKYNLNPDNQIVCIYSNNLTDGIYSNSWSIFKDNLTWLLNTIKIAKKKKDINWIIKPHPMDSIKKNIRTSEEYILKEIKYSDNMIFLKEGNKDSKYIHNIINVGISAHGSVSMELPSIGIPCIIAGDALCSGFNFTIEPKNRSEYENTINNINTFKKLSVEKIHKARIFYYLYNFLIRFSLNKNPKSFDINFYNAIKYQIKNNLRHTVNLTQLKYFE